jgi:hypothetical protein
MVPFNSCSLIFGHHTLEKSSSQREIGIRLHYYSFSRKFFSIAVSFRMTPFSPMRSDDNRRAAGAVYISAFIIHYIQTKHIGVCRPGGEAFFV